MREVFENKNIVVDGMQRNLIPPQGVEGTRGLAIREPKSRIFFYNDNFDLVFQRKEEFYLVTTAQLIRLQNASQRGSLKEIEDYLKTYSSAEMDISWYVEGIQCGFKESQKVTKIIFPNFGGEDVRGWLFKCEQFFKVDNITDDSKVNFVSIHLFDLTLMWHRQFVQFVGEDVDWNVYKAAILKRFDVAYDDPLGEIKKLKQTNQVQEYIDAFDRLLCRDKLDEKQCISLFLSGLNTKIELPIRMFNPRTLAEVYGLCKLEEAKVNALKQKPKPLILPTPRYQTQFPNTGPKPMALPTPNANWKTKPTTSTPSTPFRKQLTQRELEEKRAKNQCFYCDKKYTLGHKCSGKVYCLEVLSESMNELGDTELEEEELNSTETIEYSPHISLNAITGTNTYQTMRVCGHVGNHKLHILIDCGSTHNFLDLNNAKKLGYQLTRTCPLIPLKEGTVLINSRPYKHPPTQKDAVEAMVKELLDTVVIRDSQSPPVVMELIDELQVSQYFTSLDLRSDASHTGIGAVLQQGEHPVAYYSKNLAPRHHTLSTYEKELLAVIKALDKWMGYLLDRHFKIKTNHFSLKYLLEQRITTPSQMKWLHKLMGFDYDILDKKGSENKVADTLSRIPTSVQLLTLAFFSIYSDYVQKIVNSCKTYKPDLSAYPGLLQPLPIPKMVWSEISMDFIEGLPSSHAAQIAQVFLDNVYKLHGLPNVIVSDRAKIFISLFWKELFKALQVSLHLSTAYHPQSDGQTEVKYKGPIPNATGILPQCNAKGKILIVLVEVLDRRLGKVGNATQVFVLIKWSNGTLDDATWELHNDIVRRFQIFR
uniref:Gypsy/Ty3 retroelement polyprotein n=1 Tax=Tanacetum cinerariifolium TaxID=118510 RepID=A0A6L2P0Q2_TANCI|nr:gypsy/Ty3 retroelement polyprotein [Tanacetum cinerariifolium]